MTEVTDADREAAAFCIEQGVSHPPIKFIRSGQQDHWFFVQAFARHRLQERAAIVAWLERIDVLLGEVFDDLGGMDGQAENRAKLLTASLDLRHIIRGEHIGAADGKQA